MKFKANNIELKKLMNGDTEIVLTCRDTRNTLISELNAQKQRISGDIEVSFDKWKNKRSLNHNALFWDMCTELSNHINDPLITPYTIYKDLIKEYGISTIYPVADDMLDMVIKDWENRGEGWLTMKLRKSKIDGNFINVKFWFGSSVYNSKQFWKLVEGLKAMCRDNDLDISQYDQQMQFAIQQLEIRESKGEKYGDN